MNMRFHRIKLLYSNENSADKKLFKNLLPKNNISSIKSKYLNQLNQSDTGFNTNRNIKIKTFNKPKIKLPKINVCDKSKNNIKSQLYEIKKGNFFLTDNNKVHLNKKKLRIPKILKNNKSKKKDKNEDTEFNLDSLISKFDAEYIINAINKKKRKKNILNKMYGITSEYINGLKKAKSKKYLKLKDYQSNILKAYSFNEKNSEQSINRLSKELDDLREDIERIVPFPKINFETIFNHIKNKPKKERIKSVKSFINQEKKPKDKFELEEQLIQSMRVRRKNFKNLRYKARSFF